ncbi:MAG: cell division protease FtsH, partial [Actinomycetota bacterium]|nr:cell division protease FtsH [Actinomycetota bacterium]
SLSEREAPAVSLTKSQLHAGDQLSSVAGSTVMNVRVADVGLQRERTRRSRLWRLTAFLAVPTGLLWYRILDHRPFNPFAFPHINWLVLSPMLFFGMLILLMGGMQFGIGRSPHHVVRPEQIDVRLSDVVGIDVVKSEVVRSLNLFLSHKTFAREMGGRARRGLLFEGPPGTGKTYTAKALAAEAGVPFLFATATSFQSSFQGATQRKVRAYFRALRTLARKEGGAIGFIDEFDALGLARSGVMAFTPGDGLEDGMRCGGLEGLPSIGMPATQHSPAVGGGDLGMAVQELLVQMQSFDTPTGAQKFTGKIVESINLVLPSSRQLKKPAPKPANILLIASTNRADSLDAALLRPGRFDQRLTFEKPDKGGRRQLIDHFLARKSHVPELDVSERRDALAAVTQGYSPAMLEGMFDEALINAVQESRRAMNWKDVDHARLDAEIGLGQPVGYTEHEAKLIATHEAGHATIAWLVAPQRRLEVLTIIKRRGALGLLAHGDREEVYLQSRSELLGLIEIAMGGQSAEELFFGDVSTGPSGDLLTATRVAASMVGACGMTSSLVSFGAVQSSGFSDTNIVGRVLGDKEGRAAVEEVLQDQKLKAKALLEENRHLVEALRDALLERHELIGHEITDVLEAARARHDVTPRRLVIDLTDDHQATVAEPAG